MTIGQNNVIYPNASIGLEPQDRKYNPTHAGAGTLIGDRNIIRESVTIHRATGETPTTVGNDNYLMVNIHLAHDVVLGNHCTLVNGTLCGGHVRIEDRVILGGNSAVHQFCRVGRLAMISGTIGVTQDVPPFCTAYNTRRIGSLNRVGLRRSGLQAHVVPLSQAFDIYFRQNMSSPNAIEAIIEEVGHDPLCLEFANFIKAGKRGITSYSDSGMAYEDYAGS
jgi:UDP-N-acetylglucosamine acyltransferase